MKKWLIVGFCAVLLVGVLVGVLVSKFSSSQTLVSSQAESSQDYQAPSSPFVVAKQKLVLLCGCEGASVGATIQNANGEVLQFECEDENIARVDQNGSVFALSPGKTEIKSFIKDQKEATYFLTTVIVLPQEIESSSELVDSNKKEVSEIKVGEKYTFVTTTNVELGHYEIALVASDDVLATGEHKIEDKKFSCEIIFLSKSTHTLALKLSLNAANGEEEFVLQKLCIDNSDDDTTLSDEKQNSDETNKDNTENDHDQNNNTGENGSSNAQDQDNLAFGDQNQNSPPSNNGEEEQKPNGEQNDSSQECFCLVSTDQNLSIDGSTIHFSGFTKQKLIAVAFSIKASNQKHKIAFEIIEGDNVEIELETAMIGLCILKKGVTTFTLYALDNPTLSQTYSIIVD